MASENDAGSQGLRRRVAGVSAVVSDDAIRVLDSVPVLWVDSALPDARTFLRRSGPAIAVCAGLFELVHFQSTLPVLCALLQASDKRSAEDARDEANDLTLAEHAMLAGHVVMADAYCELRRLPTVAHLLGPRARGNVELGVSTSMALLLLHECGHVVLGHDRTGTTRANEFEADAWSIDALSAFGKSVILPSLLLLHGAFQFFQTFGTGMGDGYPDADERLEAMVARLGLGGDDAEIARRLLDAAAGRRARIAAKPSTPAAMTNRFRHTLEAADAWRFFRQLEDRMAMVGSVLDFADGTGAVDKG